MFNKLTIEDIEIEGRRVLIRADFNVPLSDKGKIVDDRKIISVLPTINYAISKGAKVILMSHLGRPEGVVESLRLAPVAERLEELLGKRIKYVKDCIGEGTRKEALQLKEGEVLLLENLRFHKEEEENDPNFSCELASLGEVYVNDAFGTAHRAHASVYGITKFVPFSAAGFLMKREIQNLNKIMEHPEKPFVAVIGGAKVTSKIGVIKNLLSKLDSLLIGGAMAYTFMLSQGKGVGDSKVEREKVSLASEVFLEAEGRHIQILLPVDFLVARRIDSKEVKVVDNIPSGWIGVDIGPETAKTYSQIIKQAKTVFLNGTMGIFEKKEFRRGTEEVVYAVASCSGVTVVGGGDTDEVVDELGLTDKITHVSTGGGACMEFLAGKELPGIVGLTDRK